ncbi:SMP-30/gluconolactonase/LRE family protein [Wenyingzhuangia sp. IMCC45574]
MRKLVAIIAVAFIFYGAAKAQHNVKSTTYLTLPNFCPTPDAYAVAPDGSLTLSCPNYAEKNVPGALVKITEDKKVKLLTTIAGIDNKGFGAPMGIAYGPDGGLYVCVNQGKNRGRVLKLTFKDDELITTEVIAKGMQAPNGIRYHNNALYVTQPILDKLKTDKNVGGVYKFSTTDRNVLVNNDRTDKQLIFSVETKNPKRQFGLDGIAFNTKGELFVGDFGDAVIYRLEQNAQGDIVNHSVYVDLPDDVGADGIDFDDKDNLYVAGFITNQIVKVGVDKKVTVLVKYADNDGTDGQIDQPSDLIVYKGQLLISNFDLMKGNGMVNTKHGKPYTLAKIDLP